ncbi:MAG: glycosyltransferase family 2 protein [Pseudomonadota bacterium]
MRISLHIGPDMRLAHRICAVLGDRRDRLRKKGVLFARSPGSGNHTRLFMAMTDPARLDPLRFNRGYITQGAQADLRDRVTRDLAREITETDPDLLILAAWQLGASMYRRSEISRVADWLRQWSNDIRIVAHLRPPAEQLLAHYALQIGEGRAVPLQRDLDLLEAPDWWDAARSAMPAIDPLKGQFEETQGPVFWLDYARLVTEWEAAFGTGSVHLRCIDPEQIYGDKAVDEVRAAFDIGQTFGRVAAENVPRLPSAATLTRGRLLNDVLLRLLAQGNRTLPRQTWAGMLDEVAIDGPPPDPSHLGAVTARFETMCQTLRDRHPGFRPAMPEIASTAWRDADPERGFRATQYLLSFMYRIDRASKASLPDRQRDLAAQSETVKDAGLDLTDGARQLLPARAVENYRRLASSPYRPHNTMGAVDEEQLGAPFDRVPPRSLPDGQSGNVIVACMKNEAPYVLEWIAYHRAIGVDRFLIYTNDCDDGTDAILDRLQITGWVDHRRNDDWEGNSPQQWALNKAISEPAVKNADWIIHIDVDEFINIRAGNGTLKDLFATTPDATNIAMTWRLFGHNGITALSGEFVIDQFDSCAPKYCPKPHTAWGFKTMFRNIGAYGKLSCHRPNKLNDKMAKQVKWVNGSGQDMTRDAARNGWRSSRETVGYDIVQLNHYALRSAESFLIKRQRGRALHVDRSIGLNYWIRMDWSAHRDVTIKRNLPRLRQLYDELLTDPALRRWHEAGLDWHRDKAAELRAMPEFASLYDQAIGVRLTDTERAAYALALDMDS